MNTYSHLCLYYYYDSVQINYLKGVKMTQDKNDEMQGVKPTELKDDLTEQIDYDLLKKSRELLKSVNPAVKDKQQRLNTFIDPYTPKPYGSKRTYPQDNWSLYAKSLGREKINSLAIINDGIDFLNIGYNYKGNGRPPADLNEIAKALVIGSYNNFSSWKIESELDLVMSAMGILDRIPAKSTLNKYRKDPALTPILEKLCKLIAEPLAPLEDTFIVDASGISNSYGNKKWREIRHKRKEQKERRKFSKIHIMIGAKTKIISAVMITEGYQNENRTLIPLLNETAKIFKNRQKVLADAGYLSKANAKAIADTGAVPYIRTKKNVHIPMKGITSAYGNMLREQKINPTIFDRIYNKRAVVEAVFSSFKRTRTSFCRSKYLVSQRNELLAKVVCHNASILSRMLLRHNLKCKFL